MCVCVCVLNKMFFCVHVCVCSTYLSFTLFMMRNLFLVHWHDRLATQRLRMLLVVRRRRRWGRRCGRRRCGRLIVQRLQFDALGLVAGGRRDRVGGRFCGQWVAFQHSLGLELYAVEWQWVRIGNHQIGLVVVTCRHWRPRRSAINSRHPRRWLANRSAAGRIPVDRGRAGHVESVNSGMKG